MAADPGTSAFAVVAALLSPACATAGIVLYAQWGGTAANLNLFKCALATALFLVVGAGAGASAATMFDVTPLALRMLVLSSFIGIVVGDVMWLQALQLLGDRLTVLMSTVQPLLATVAGAIFLQQPIRRSAAAGIATVCLGLAIAQFMPAATASSSAAGGGTRSRSKLVLGCT